MRTARETKTVRAMIRIYCVKHHRSDRARCNECQQLLDYAEKRIDRCPLTDDKPTCANCPIHCYEESRREQIRSVMRYSGPRMIYHHPILSVRHLADGRKKEGKGFAPATSREPPTP
ncbi:MAG: nitrous oxide-stimulated promoter family protein [Thermoplasmatota archaeon]|nr:nitrous oxide-stimulated promoter family protein [Candidatus Thermoplasmatota archaeon]MBU1913906.1 nitrous oxide-stimulated promoter family protein [Candidatus Thermoplasmatota archaeon]